MNRTSEEIHPKEMRIDEMSKFRQIVKSLKVITQLIDKSNKKRLARVLIAHGLISITDLIAISVIALIASTSLSELRGTPIPSIFHFWSNIKFFSDKTFVFEVIVLSVIATMFFTFRTVMGIYLNGRVFKILGAQSLNLSNLLLKKLLDTQILNDPNKKSQRILFAITKGVDLLMIQFLGVALVTCIDGIMLLAIACGLFFYNLISALSIFVIFGLVFGFSASYLSIRARKFGLMLSEMTASSNQHLLETFTLYPEIRLRNRVDFFVDKANEFRSSIVNAQTQMALLPNLTKYFYEIAMVYGALIVTGIQIMISDANAAISNLAVYLAASSRVVPALARIQNSFISINHNLASCSMTLDLIEEIEGYFDNKKQSVSDQIRPRNHFIPSIDFQNVSFKYPDSDCNALSNISFRINQGSFVAIIGESGAGKSTLAKLILGNLTPTNGSVRVSNCPADKVAQTWPGAVAYLPQKVIALDSNILQNVSFEKDSNSDQIETIRFLLKEVELEEFNSSSSLTKIIGEFGNSLSGGQLQRLGIARALFSQPSLIVLDEPTSAMDPITERIVLDRILARESCTKVVVAHRLATISKADLVIVLNQGRIEVVDTYEVVQKTHSLLLKGIQNQ